MRDPMGLLLMAGRVDPVLREATHAVEAELTDLRALRDAIPGDDKRLVAEWMVAYCRLMFSPLVPLGLDELDRRHEALSVMRAACPPSVRAALTQSKGD